MNGQALVTGAGKRLGRAMALYLADRGFDVAVHYNGSRDEAAEVVNMIRAKGRRAEAVQADLLIEEETQGLLPAATKALGGPFSVLINSASIFEHDDLKTSTRESWDRAIESNLRAPLVLTQAFAAQVREPDVGGDWNEPTANALIINMVDQRVRKLTPFFMSYTVAKMGLWALTQTSAQALAPNVRVNAIGPGPTMQGARQSDDHFAKQRRATILERGASPNDVCQALGYFIDAPAVTGQLLCVDGGQHLAWKTSDIQGVE